MAIDQHKKEGDVNNNTKLDKEKKDLETESPISERDEVKKAEKRTQDLQKNISNSDSKKSNWCWTKKPREEIVMKMFSLAGIC